MHRREKLSWLCLAAVAAVMAAIPPTCKHFAIIPFVVRHEGSLKLGFEREVSRYDPSVTPRLWLDFCGLEAGTGLIGGMRSDRGKFLCWYAYVAVSYGWLAAAFGIVICSLIAWRRLRRSRASKSALR